MYHVTYACGCNEYKIRYRLPDMWLWVNQFEFPVVECVDCGLVFVNPRPTQEAISYGVDYFSDKVDYKEINFFNKLFFDCNFENNFFDIIVSFAVFEHLHQPSLYFEESSRVLKENGKLIILVTNSESLYGKRAKIEDVPRHTYHFSEKTLAKYGQKYNLDLNKVYYDDDIFDGRGTGSFKWLISDFLKITYEDYYFKKISFFKRGILKIASKIDKLIFSIHWEKEKKQSGIIIAEFVKKA